MPKWFLFAAGTLLLWGVWGVLLKMAVNRLGPHTTWLVHSFSFFCWVLLYKLATGFKLSTQTGGILLTVLAALFASSGGLLLLTALWKGKASTVLPFVALYPAIVVLLSLVFLRETMTASQWVGVVLAIAAGVFLGR